MEAYFFIEIRLSIFVACTGFEKEVFHPYSLTAHQHLRSAICYGCTSVFSAAGFRPERYPEKRNAPARHRFQPDRLFPVPGRTDGF